MQPRADGKTIINVKQPDGARFFRFFSEWCVIFAIEKRNKVQTIKL